MIDWSKYPDFSEREFQCKCGCGRANMSIAFMRRLQGLRTYIGEPFKITSGFRCPAHNAKVSKTGTTGPHTTGKAADIACSHTLAWEILTEATDHGFTGLGVNQKGKSRFLHLDILPNAAGQPRPHIWSY